MKMPTPITFAMTMAAASTGPRRRSRAWDEGDGDSGTGALYRQSGGIMDATPLVLQLVSLACSLVPWPLRPDGSTPEQGADRFVAAREQMVARQIADRGV